MGSGLTGFTASLGSTQVGGGLVFFDREQQRGAFCCRENGGEGERCKGRRGRETKTIQMNQTGGGRAQCGQFIAPPGAGRIQMDTS